MSGAELVGELAPKYDFWALADMGIPVAEIANTSRIAGWFLGDEPDEAINDNLRMNMANTTQRWRAFPSIPTYVGGSRNRYQGAWANTVDLKGLDFTLQHVLLM